MNFDEHRYIREVLEPARTAGHQPPDDLRVRYALPDKIVFYEVAAHVKRVRLCWRKARGQLRFRRLIDRLEGDHLRLAPLFERAASGDLEPLLAELDSAATRAVRRDAELGTRLLDAAGVVKMLAPADLREIGGNAAELVRSYGIDVREPDSLPTAPPYPGYARAREALDALGHRHLREFLTGEPRAGRVLEPEPALGALIERASEQWSRRPHDSNRTNADTVLIALKQTRDRTAELIRYDVVARLRERHQQRASEQALLRFAVDDLGVDEDDARRLVFAVGREAGGAPGGLAARLRDLITSGEVHAAAELVSMAGPEELTGDLEVLAGEARRRIASATALRQEAASLVLSDPDEAWLRLADALQLVGDLPGAAELQAGLSPRPPGRPEAIVDGAEVTLSWPPTLSRVGDIGYRVVRAAHRGPRHLDDGDPVAADGAFARDPAPPVNVPLYYTVFAVRGTAASAPVTIGPVCVRPEPAGLSLAGADGVVAGRWNCPAEAVRVIVTRDGVPIPAERNGLRDDTVTNGTTYRYRVCAIYLDEDGREVVTAGVHGAVTPAARPEPVTRFSIEHDPAGHLTLTYDEPRAGQVEFVALTGPPPWPRGTTVSMAEVGRAGRVLPSTPVPGGVAVRAGPGVLLAITVGGDVATVGTYREHVSLTPPRELIAQRRGGVIMLGFDWPRDVTEAEVRWRAGTGERRTLLVGRAGYDAHGGVRLPAAAGERVTIEVAAAGTAYGRRVTGAVTTAVVPGTAVVEYELRRTRLRGAVQLTLTAPAPALVRRLVLVTRRGPIPQRPGDGEIVAAWEDLDVSQPVLLEAPMPRSARPFWLRCFAEDETVELRDPPVRQMRMG